LPLFAPSGAEPHGWDSFFFNQLIVQKYALFLDWQKYFFSGPGRWFASAGVWVASLHRGSMFYSSSIVLWQRASKNNMPSLENG
jgi:hypothetical protein